MRTSYIDYYLFLVTMDKVMDKVSVSMQYHIVIL